MSKIQLSRLKEIIQEEVALLKEGEEHEFASQNALNASKLLKAIDSSKKNFSEKAKSELSSAGLDRVEAILKRIIESPLEFVDMTKQITKKVSLKSQNKKTL